MYDMQTGGERGAKNSAFSAGGDLSGVTVVRGFFVREDMHTEQIHTYTKTPYNLFLGLLLLIGGDTVIGPRLT